MHSPVLQDSALPNGSGKLACTNRLRRWGCGVRLGSAPLGSGDEMFGWRRKSDGFEWHEHVRTTIRIRREDRRRRIDDARNLAAEGLSSAGRAGVAAGSSGLNFLGQSAKRLGEAILDVLAGLMSLLPIVWEMLRTGSRRAVNYAADGFVALASQLFTWSGHALEYASRALMNFGCVLSKATQAGAVVSAAGLGATGKASYRLLVIGSNSLRSSTALPLVVLVGAVAAVAAVVRLTGSGV